MIFDGSRTLEGCIHIMQLAVKQMLAQKKGRERYAHQAGDGGVHERSS